ncbi:hypothetical protein AN958_02492 [Leucoagaricus sp. SymC.cos]|nr:hypothetical protein AN958_02492 [Leucoagaricus sp. SymC.cos]
MIFVDPINLKLTAKPRKQVVLFIPILILIYLLPSNAVIGSPVLTRPLRRQNPPIPTPIPPPPPGGTPTTTWTYNYWWPFPPAGGATPTITTTTASSTPGFTATDHITLVLPISPTSPSSSTGFQDPTVTEAPSSTISTFFTTIASSSTTAPPPSTASASPLTTDKNNAETFDIKPHKFNILYLVPVFAVVGVVVLAGVVWLIYGCCTRRPKYRSSFSRPSSRFCRDLNRAPTGLPDDQIYEKDAFSREKMELGEQHATFRAFRYEDLAEDPGHEYSYDDAVGDTGVDVEVVPRCRHTREFGFECDCRQSLIESELHQFRWPCTQLEDIPDEDEGMVGRSITGGGGYSHRTSVRSNYTQCTSGVGPSGKLTPLEMLSESGSEADCLSQNGVVFNDEGGDRRVNLPVKNFDGTEPTNTIGRQGKLLESVQLQEKKWNRTPRRGVTKKSRKLTKSMKSVKSTKTSKTAWTERSVYSRDSAVVDGEAVDSDDVGGFRMMVESPPPSQNEGAFRPLRVSLGREAQIDPAGDAPTDGWMGKMADVIGSSFSRLSDKGKDEDKYTALPGPSDRPNKNSPLRPSHDQDESGSAARRSKSKLSRQASRALKACKSSRRRKDSVDYAVEMSEDEIERQRRRLQNHRASIASLPIGMVYSPPLLGVDVFGGEEKVNKGPGAVFSPGREKQLPHPPV